MSTKSEEHSGSDLESRALPAYSDSVHSEDPAHSGVKRVEATHRVFGKYSKWALFLSIALASYIYSLDGTTTYNYLSWATSSFGKHTLISTIQVAQSMIIACGKPVVAKISDVTSRGTAYCIVVFFYCLGYIVIASAQSASTIAGGIVLYAIGYTGLQLLTQIIIADITVLKWRGAVSSLTSLPFIINGFVGSNIAAQVLEHSSWRWGYGMFAILVPVALAPLISTLIWADSKARKLGYISKSRSSLSAPTRFWQAQKQLDIMGLLLLGASVTLILLPLTLAKNAKGQWNNPSMIAMIVVGCILFPTFLVYDWKVASFPIVPARFLRNRSVVFASLIGFFDFVSFYISYTYLYSFVAVTKDWSLVNLNYFGMIQTIALTFFGICAGFYMFWSRRYKYQLIVGLCIRMLGVGLMIHSRGANASTAEVVWSQILQGLGGGIAAVASQVGAQASVPHVDVATVTAIVLLITEIGGAIGTGIAGAIWSQLMPGKLRKYLPNATDEEITTLFGSIVTASASPRGDPTREGVISAYSDVMKIMTIVATVFAIFPIILATFMPNWYLGDFQNAVDERGLAGEAVADSTTHANEQAHGRHTTDAEEPKEKAQH